jgi:hypothetical protein
MGLAHKISNHGLLTFRAGQAVQAGASEWKVAQSKGRANLCTRGWRGRFGAAVGSVVVVVVRFWGTGMCRYSLFLALELAPAPGMASPVLGGDSAVLVVGAVGSWSLGCVWWPPSQE